MLKLIRRQLATSAGRNQKASRSQSSVMKYFEANSAPVEAEQSVGVDIEASTHGRAEGTSKEFHRLAVKLLDELEATMPGSVHAGKFGLSVSDMTEDAPLKAVVDAVSTTQDAFQLQSVIRQWRLHGNRYDRNMASHVLMKLHDEIKAYGPLTAFLCNRKFYRLPIANKHVMTLLLNQREQILGETGDEAAMKDQLDTLFKIFAIALYYSVSPSPTMYSVLITACCYSASREGLRRAEMTMDEVVSLGWKPDADSVVAIANAYVEHSLFAEALKTLDEYSSLAETNSAIDLDLLTIKLRAAVGLKDPKAILAVLGQLSSVKTDLDTLIEKQKNQTSLFGAEFRSKNTDLKHLVTEASGILAETNSDELKVILQTLLK